MMVWYEKALFAAVVVLFLVGLVDLVVPLGFGWPIFILVMGLSVLCVVLIVERRKRESSGSSS